jgi:hypothetical protein
MQRMGVKSYFVIIAFNIYKHIFLFLLPFCFFLFLFLFLFFLRIPGDGICMYVMARLRDYSFLDP